MWVVAALTIAVPLVAQESDRNADGRWQEAFHQEYERLVDEAGIPPEVASMVREQVGPDGAEVSPELAAGLAADQAERVEAALRRGARPNQVAAEVRSTLRREIARRAEEAEGQSPGEAAEGAGPPDGVPAEAARGERPGQGRLGRDDLPGRAANRALEAIEQRRGPRPPTDPGARGGRGRENAPERLPPGASNRPEDTGPPDGTGPPDDTGPPDESPPSETGNPNGSDPSDRRPD